MLLHHGLIEEYSRKEFRRGKQCPIQVFCSQDRLLMLSLCICIALVLPSCASSSAQQPSPTASTNAIPSCLDKATPPLCYSPQELRTAYALQPLIDQGITGKGITVILPEVNFPEKSPATSDIQTDVRLFNRLFRLPDLHLQVIDPVSGLSTTTNAAGNEEVMDVEMVHAIAPAAAIDVIPMNINFSQQKTPDELAMMILRPIQYAIDHHLGQVISLSMSAGEHCLTSAGLQAIHRVARAAWVQHITFVASSGDFGAVGSPCTSPNLILEETSPSSPLEKEAGLPAADPLVLAVGGTSLTAVSKTGRYTSETVWRRANFQEAIRYDASGGGFSSRIARPAYQQGISGPQNFRGIPDVAADADGQKNLLIVNGSESDQIAGGTSASAPLWAGIVALADQEAARPLGFLNAAIYRIGQSSAYFQAFHDIISGTNTQQVVAGRKVLTIPGYQAGPGWDAVTGWGTPRAVGLVPLLIHYDHANDGNGL